QLNFGFVLSDPECKRRGAESAETAAETKERFQSLSHFFPRRLSRRPRRLGARILCLPINGGAARLERQPRNVVYNRARLPREFARGTTGFPARPVARLNVVRSEEHTSELQSRRDLV